MDADSEHFRPVEVPDVDLDALGVNQARGGAPQRGVSVCSHAQVLVGHMPMGDRVVLLHVSDAEWPDSASDTPGEPARSHHFTRLYAECASSVVCHRGCCLWGAASGALL